MSNATVATLHSLRITERKWVRLATPRWGFWWRAAVPCALLLACFGYAVSRFASRTIAATVQTRAQMALAEAGLPWVDVATDGQALHLTGTAPSPEAAARAEAVARNARCPNWSGQPICARRVTSAWSFAQAQAPMWHDLTIERTGTKRILMGSVPDEAAKLALGSKVAGPGVTVDNRLTIQPIPAVPAWEAMRELTTFTIQACEAGKVTLAAGTLTVRCNVTQNQKATIQRALAPALPGGKLGEVQLIAREDVAQCDTGIAKLLARSNLRFETGKADIHPASEALLTQLARAVAACPGTLRVEGHTDNIGKAPANLQLSDARARAVRDALIKLGIPAAKLVARGFGDSKPTMSNATPEGRARNRRIEFHVEQATE